MPSLCSRQRCAKEKFLRRWTWADENSQSLRAMRMCGQHRTWKNWSKVGMTTATVQFSIEMSEKWNDSVAKQKLKCHESSGYGIRWQNFMRKFNIQIPCFSKCPTSFPAIHVCPLFQLMWNRVLIRTAYLLDMIWYNGIAFIVCQSFLCIVFFFQNHSDNYPHLMFIYIDMNCILILCSAFVTLNPVLSAILISSFMLSTRRI